MCIEKISNFITKGQDYRVKIESDYVVWQHQTVRRQEMNARLNRILDEITRTEEKIAAWQAHLEELHIRRKQLEDAEIIKSIRSMKMGSREMLSFLEHIQNGVADVRQEQPDMDAVQAEDKPHNEDSDNRPVEDWEGTLQERSLVEEPGRAGYNGDSGNEIEKTGYADMPDGISAGVSIEREDKEDEI